MRGAGYTNGDTGLWGGGDGVSNGEGGDCGRWIGECKGEDGRLVNGEPKLESAVMEFGDWIYSSNSSYEWGAQL